MKCVKCNSELESDDNFCYNCGEWTAKGYNYLKDNNNVKAIKNGAVFKHNERLRILTSLLSIGILLFVGMLIVRGDDLFKPLVVLQKQVVNYFYGYNTSAIKTDNKYTKEVSSYEDAINLIKEDFNSQAYICSKDNELRALEYKLEDDYNIPSVLFCDMNYEEALKISNVITKMYDLFPNIKGTLTNITIANAPTKEEYIAYFQPMYQFVNVNTNKTNKVNKTQILLNSYYFLNSQILNQKLEKVVGENWYVKDATWESTIAHELGHFITFKAYLKENNLENITFITEENASEVDELMQNFEDGFYALDIVNEALNRYNNKYNTRIDLDTFISSISKYANIKDEKGNLMALETIAEAIHDYYLHGNNMQKSSLEIVNIMKEKLGI